MREMFYSQVTIDLLQGLQTGRYQIRQETLASVISLIAGATLGAIFMVREGIKTWRDAGTEAVELLLRAPGIPAEEALRLARLDLPPLPAVD